MLETVTLEEAQTHLPELVARLVPGEELTITQNERLVAKLIKQSALTRRPRQPGSAIGRLVIHSEDDEHLTDFSDYMP
jgi:antitoxin (DNA-binding transcriptional repressor) of toxin-antitoxin stability system